MADKPILFSAPMVRALLAGTKTQTRRLLDAWTDAEPPAFVEDGKIIAFDERERPYRWPRTHAVGDRLWVKETWRPFSLLMRPWDIEVSYAADDARRIIEDGDFGENDWTFPKAAARGNVTPLFMPRWASRITLTVTDVRVQRLQDISEDDALAEGMTDATAEAIMSPEELSLYAATHILCPDARGRLLYQHIWDHINGTRDVPEPWALNPWVAAYTFTVALGNIDGTPK